MKEEKSTGTKKIDWDEVHRRLESAQAAIDHGANPAPEEKRRILKERASLLAREPEKEADEGERLDVLEFAVAGERYAVAAKYITEVYPLKKLTPLPGTASFVLGITSVRGRILPVIDIKKLLDLPEKGLAELDKAIVVKSDGMEIGIRADSIAGISFIPRRDIQPPLPALTGIREKYLAGITGERLIILDVAKLLADKSLVIGES